jgi:hypothetical protein
MKDHLRIAFPLCLLNLWASFFVFTQPETSFWQNQPYRPALRYVRSRFLESLSGRARQLRVGLSVCSVLFFSASMPAQTVQFLPEVDGYLKLNNMFRIYYEAKDDRDGGDSTQVTNGPSLQLYLKPLLKLKRITTFDLDDSKPRALVLEAGYRYITAPNEPNDNRFLVAATSHFPMKAAFLITDRNRADMDWKGGKANWRYRNKLTLERTFAIHSYHLIPYVAFEPYYESQYDKWSTTTEFAGCLLPVGKHVEFNPYYEHENDTGKHPNVSSNFVGLAVYFFFSLEGTGQKP